jgi:hypothetical protein
VWKEFEDHARKDMLPKMESSAMVMAMITSAEPDLKLAVEIGACLLLGKPLVLLIMPGSKPPDALVRAAELIIEGDLDDPVSRDKVTAMVKEAMEKYQ